MLHKYSFTSACKDVLTLTSLSILATVSVPSQVFSLTTEIADIQGKTNQIQISENNTLTNLFSSEKSNFLIADKKYKDRKDDDDDDNNYYRNRESNRKQKYQSSKYYRVKDWNCLFTVGKLVNSNQRALVLYLDILEKPSTKYANVIHTVYARQNNRWVQFYSTNGSRKIEKRGKKYFLNPEVIEFRNLRLGNINLSRSDLRIVTEISYDSRNKREERLVFEDVWNYSSISEINSISQITNVSTTTTVSDYNSNYRRNDNDDDDDNYNRGREDRKEEKRYLSKAFRDKDWNGFFKIGKLVNSNQRALVVQLDILEKPVTKYANVVYKAYTFQNNRWIPFYTSSGARLIEKNAGKYFLTPEIIEFNKLRLGNIDLSQSDLRFVTEIRYDSNTQRDERLVFENIWNYSSISEINSINQLSVVNY